ncbi:MAG: hypothetical protein RL701_7452 [Pseudomonadota bacterium]
MLAAAWNNPAGGIRYHLRALRHRSAWGEFRAGLSSWLTTWQPARSTLAIVGPSAGHCLPLGALAQFERFIVFELDPLACFMLKRRFERELPGRPIEWVTRDAWLDPVRHGNPLPRELLGADSALLFSNIIGQIPYLLATDEYPDWRREWCRQLFPWLEQTPWASFHDRVSGDVAPFAALPTEPGVLSDAEVSALYEANPTSQLIELNDHRSQDLLPAGYHYRYLHWPITPSMHHLIECVFGGPNS